MGRRASPGVGGRLVGALRRDRALRDEGFERLYEEHAAGLLSFLSLRTSDRALAEDLLADTFERVLRKRGTFDRRRGSEKTWLYSIALNLLRDHARRSRTGRGATERLQFERGTEAPDRSLEQVEDRDVVGRVLGVLSAEEREAVALRFGADLTVPEIAELTGNSLTTMEGRVYRALRKLRAELDGPAS
jgi:RNA polymerase sigma factor (sigma-70 family)